MYRDFNILFLFYFPETVEIMVALLTYTFVNSRKCLDNCRWNDRVLGIFRRLIIAVLQNLRQATHFMCIQFCQLLSDCRSENPPNMSGDNEEVDNFSQSVVPQTTDNIPTRDEVSQVPIVTPFDLFLKRLSQILRLNIDEKHDIEASVKEMINALMREVVRKDTRYVVLEVIETGSSYDGTKILSPDEFDYLVVVSKFSEENCQLVKRECENNLGFAHVQLRRESCAGWDDLVSDEGLLKTKAFRNRFRHIGLDHVCRDNPEIHIRKTTGTLHIDGCAVAMSGPQWNVNFVWKPRSGNSWIKISVDVCPTIKYCNVPAVLNVEDTANGYVYRTIERVGHVLLIPRPQATCEHCFKLVFAEADRQLVKNLNEQHKQCLIVLKFICSQIRDHDYRLNKLFNSFAIKMVVLHHSFHCDSSCTVDCMQNILYKVERCLDESPPKVPSVFINRHNVWRNVLGTGTSVNQQVLRVTKAILANLREFFSSSSLPRDQNFEELKEKLIGICKHKKGCKRLDSAETFSEYQVI